MAVIEEEQVSKGGREVRQLWRDGARELVGVECQSLERGGVPERRRDRAGERDAADVEHGEAAAPPEVVGDGAREVGIGDDEGDESRQRRAEACGRECGAREVHGLERHRADGPGGAGAGAGDVGPVAWGRSGW